MECISLNLPLHTACNPLHVPFARHFLVAEPLRRNPGSQLNATLLGNTVKLPVEEPFFGADRGPQSTARKASLITSVPALSKLSSLS